MNMRIIRATLVLLTFFSFLADAATIPSDNAAELEARDPRRRKRPGKSRPKGLPKYFHEPGGSELGNHYDSRYEHGIQDYADKKDTQLHMLRAYLTFFHENKIETWLAHGTLLGWWWNGKMLPWDWDIDTQVSGSTLRYLGDHFNFTHYDYVSNDDPPVKRTYLLDINPAAVERERGNGLNIIDARWIDTRNGLYIDITGLSETHPDDQPGVWACKNYHRYHTTDLYPMRESMYEGVIAKVPYAYDRILTQEYEEKALVLTEYEGHRWDPVVKEWIKKSDDELKQEKAEKDAAKKEKEEAKKKQQEKEKQEEEKKKAEEAKKKQDTDEQSKLVQADKDEAARQKEQMKKMEAEKSNGNDNKQDGEKKDQGQKAEVKKDQSQPGTQAPSAEDGKKKEDGSSNQRLRRREEILNLERETNGLKHLMRKR